MLGFRIGDIDVGIRDQTGCLPEPPPNVDCFRTTIRSTSAEAVFVEETPPNYTDYHEIFYDREWLRIMKGGDDYIFLFASDKKDYIEGFHFSHSKNQGRFYVKTENIGAQSAHPIESTPFQLFFMLLLQSHQGFLLHANSVKIGDSGISFCGMSGSGKTTLCNLFSTFDDHTILTDETCLIRCDEDRVLIYGTPWKGSNSDYYANDKAELRRLYFIEHGATNKIEPMNRLDAIGMAMLQSFPYFWDRACMTRNLHLIARVLSRVRYQRLAFVPNSSIVETILMDI